MWCASEYWSWGPKYLQESKGFTIGQSSQAGAAFEIVGIFGAYGAGWLSDRTFRGRRGPVSVIFMLLLTATVLGLLRVPAGNFPAMVGVFSLLGFFVYGPQLLVAVAAADFATKQASATAVGLTGLFGYIGASVCSGGHRAPRRPVGLERGHLVLCGRGHRRRGAAGDHLEQAVAVC